MSARYCCGCGVRLSSRGRGRPPKRCERCNKDKLAARQRAYYERNKDKIAAQQRAYRERTMRCARCGEELRKPVPSRLCGFCEAEG